MHSDGETRTTIVIPAWDGYAGTALEAAVASLVQQDRSFRLVVVDNASTTRLPNLQGARVIRATRRLTLGAARNLGLADVQTPYVIFWDADDLMLPGALAILEEEIERDPGLVAAGMAIREAPSGQRHRWPRRWLQALIRFPRLLAALDCIWSLYPTTGATIMRTGAARASGGFADADSGEDWCLGVSLALRGRVGWTEVPGRVYLQHSESVWARHLTIAHQRVHARAVRRRLREDPETPEWLRAALPLISALQCAAIATHAGVTGVRRLRRSVS